MSISEIVNVQIDRQTTGVSRAGFGTLLFVGESEAFTSERVRFYTQADDMLDDGFESSDAEYIAAVKYFSQEIRPAKIAIGAKLSTDSTWTDAINAIYNENSDWYAIAISSRTQANQEELATWTESHDKIFGCSSNNSGMLATTTTDVAATLAANEREKSFVIYHEDSDGTSTDNWPEVAWFGAMLPRDPGSATWKFKTLSGVTASQLTATQVTNLQTKNCNMYRVIGGVSIAMEGTMASGEYIDIIRGTHWLKARMMERVYALLVNADKIPYTDAGIAAIEAEVKAQLQTAVDVGLLKSDPKPETSVPLVADIDTADKAAREFNDLTFTAQYAGAVHKTTIQGTISL